MCYAKFRIEAKPILIFRRLRRVRAQACRLSSRCWSRASGTASGPRCLEVTVLCCLWHQCLAVAVIAHETISPHTSGTITLIAVTNGSNNLNNNSYNTITLISSWNTLNSPHSTSTLTLIIPLVSLVTPMNQSVPLVFLITPMNK